MMIKGLKWLGSRASNFTGMAAFYRDVLGFSLVSESSDCADFELPNGDRVEVFAPRFAPEEPLDVPVVGFLVDDVVEARRGLERRGVEFIGPVHEGTSLAWSYFRAPDGHVYEITGPIHASETGSRMGSTREAREFRYYYFSPNYEATVAFYRDGLGLSTARSWNRGPADRGTIFLPPGGAGLIEIEAGGDAPPPQGGIYMEVADVDAWYDRSKNKGLRVSRALADTSYGHRSFTLVDPGGLKVGLFSYLRG